MEQIAGSVAGALITSLFMGDNQSAPPPAPEPEKPAAIPTANSDAVAGAKRRSIAAQVARRGRASTILTEPDEKLGT